MNVLQTDRLRLRPIELRDHASFIAMNLDPKVMRYFHSTFTPELSAEHLARYALQLTRDGFSFLTLELLETRQYLGIVGMQIMHVAVPNLPQTAVELGWRLTRNAHGHGYATEAARAVVDHAFNQLNLRELNAVISANNAPSQRVAEKLGMTLRPELTFTYPTFLPGDSNGRHYLYSLAKSS